MLTSGEQQWESFRSLCRILGGQDSSFVREHSAAELQHIVDLADSLRLLPALADSLTQQIGALSSASLDAGELRQDMAPRLTAALKANTLRNMAISAQSLSLARCLNAADIEPLFLKGTAYLHSGLENRLGFRQQVDIDIAVPEAAIPTAVTALRRGGYRFFEEEYTAPIDPRAGPSPTAGAVAVSKTALNAHHHHLYPLIRDDQPVSVELHRHYLPRRFQRGNDMDDLFSRAGRLARAEAAFLVPGPEDQLVQLLLGSVVHDGYLLRRQFPLREACDYQRLLFQHPTVDLQHVAARCGKSLATFDQLVRVMLNDEAGMHASAAMEGLVRRYRSPLAARLFDAYARCSHLAHGLRHNPGKLAQFLTRKIAHIKGTEKHDPQSRA